MNSHLTALHCFVLKVFVHYFESIEIVLILLLQITKHVLSLVDKVRNIFYYNLNHQ